VAIVLLMGCTPDKQLQHDSEKLYLKSTDLHGVVTGGGRAAGGEDAPSSSLLLSVMTCGDGHALLACAAAAPAPQPPRWLPDCHAWR